MDNFTNNFEYMYAVASNGTLDSTSSVGFKVDISDPDTTLSENSRFQVSGSDGPFDGTYTFLTRATTADGSGFLAKDSHGHAFFFTDHAATVAGAPLTPEPGPVSICFMAGTRIKTPEGEAAIETLRIGDLVSTTDGGTMPIRWIGRQTVVRVFADRAQLPICIRAGALADALPARDLYVSPNHALMLDGVLVQAGCLVNETSIARMLDVPQRFTYFHIELENHALILAEDTPAETFLDSVDRSRFDNWDEHDRLYGQTEMMADMPLPRCKARRQVPKALRERLAQRADTHFAADLREAA